MKRFEDHLTPDDPQDSANLCMECRYYRPPSVEGVAVCLYDSWPIFDGADERYAWCNAFQAKTPEQIEAWLDTQPPRVRKRYERVRYNHALILLKGNFQGSPAK